MQTIGFIGGGNMAQALIEGILQNKLYAPRSVWVSDVRPKRLAELRAAYGVHITQVNTELTAAADMVVLSVKPQLLGHVLDDIAGTLRPSALVVSIAAGKTCNFILERLGKVQLVRVMPNTPALVGAGMAGLYNATASAKGLKAVSALFNAVGKTAVVDDEDLIDSVTAVSGSGPAYFFLLMEEMIKAGVELGLPENIAAELVLQTAKGAALLAEKAQEKGQTPSLLRKNVTSPGGTTEAAVHVFEAAQFSQMVQEAITTACERGKELSAGD
ncbi:MAG: pyrroline-5-carboxylate reductase [Phycisphaerae bacterium]|nr:pyrroline-5-carboxylate reductase [Phycisphaerae bacterium]